MWALFPPTEAMLAFFNRAGGATSVELNLYESKTCNKEGR